MCNTTDNWADAAEHYANAQHALPTDRPPGRPYGEDAEFGLEGLRLLLSQEPLTAHGRRCVAFAWEILDLVRKYNITLPGLALVLLP